jgi:DNA-binding LytR/AlgR family response regulator
MKNLKAYIVDDERNACKAIELALVDVPGVVVTGYNTSADRALPEIISLQPDIIFLDVEMPQMSGLEFGKKLQSVMPNVGIVYSTAHDKYAVEALNLGALAYILKPIDLDAVREAVEKYHSWVARTREIYKQAVIEPKAINKLRFDTKYGSVFISPDDLIYISAERNYTRLFLRDGSEHLVTQQLGTIEKMLPEANYIRIHRSVIINIQFLSNYNKKERYVLLTVGEAEIKLNIPSKRLKELSEVLTKLYK